jgi:gamma-glutamylputrescine oxidase
MRHDHRRPGADCLQRLHRGLEPVTAAHVMPIRSFIGATVPLGRTDSPVIIPGGESVDDSRFVVRYFRKRRRAAAVRRARGLYGGQSARHLEPYPQADRRALPGAERCRDHPFLGRLGGDHLPRRPFVREVMPGVTAAAASPATG